MEFKLIDFLKVLTELTVDIKSIKYEIILKDSLEIKVSYIRNSNIDKENILDYLEDRLVFDDFENILDIEEVEVLDNPNLIDNFMQVHDLIDNGIGVFYSPENKNYYLKNYNNEEIKIKSSFSTSHLKEITKFKETRDENGRSSYVEILDDFNMRLNEINLKDSKSKFELVVKDYSNLKYFIDKVKKDMIAVIWLLDSCDIDEIRSLEEALMDKDIVLKVCPTYKRLFL